MTMEGAIHPHEKTCYRPIEIAIRWCNLMDQEGQILALAANHTAFQQHNFGSWPCISHKLEMLWKALRRGEILSGPLDASVGSEQAFDPWSFSIPHLDLKYWFIQHRPSDKPGFLFTEAERRSPHNVSHDVFHELLHMFDVATIKLQHEQLRVGQLNAERVKLQKARHALDQELTELRSNIRNLSTPSEHSEAAYLQLIGELLKLILGHSPSGQPYSTLTSQAAIIDKLIAYNPNRYGFSQRTLEQRFSAANRSLLEADPHRKSR